MLPCCILIATRARAVQQVLGNDYPIDVAKDHGASISAYLRDPDGTGIELYHDLPREMWFDPQGRPMFKAEPFDPYELIAELKMPPGLQGRQA